MYKGKTVSVVMSTYKEKDSIRQCIDDFFLTDLVDEVIVVNNNAIDGTNEEVLKTNAKLIFQPKQGYGHGFQMGLASAIGDFLVMCEPDGTFTPSEIEKLLVYTDIYPPIHPGPCSVLRTPHATIKKSGALFFGGGLSM